MLPGAEALVRLAYIAVSSHCGLCRNFCVARGLLYFDLNLDVERGGDKGKENYLERDCLDGRHFLLCLPFLALR